MAKDPDHFNDYSTSNQWFSIISSATSNLWFSTISSAKPPLRKNYSFFPVGFNLSQADKEWSRFLNSLPIAGIPIQVCSGPLVGCSVITSIPDWLIELVKYQKVRLIVHLPFAINFWKFKPYMLKYLEEVFSYYHSILPDNQVLFVAHVNYPDKTSWDEDCESCISLFKVNYQNTLTLLTKTKFRLLIENLAGNKSMGIPSLDTPEFIHKALLSNVFLEVSHGGICLDTEHNFAHGSDLPPNDSPIWSSVHAVHLNSCPSNVTKGSCVDLHSFTRLRESTLSPQETPFTETSLKNFLEFLSVTSLPAVFERRSVLVQAEDFSYCCELLNQENTNELT